MALYQLPLEAILEAIKTQNNVDLVEAEYVFGNPVVIPTGPAGENTSMTITAKDIQSTYDGSVPIKYKRLDLADLATLISTSIKGYNLDTVMDVANRLNQLHGLNFTEEDFTDGPAGTVDGNGTVTLTAKATSRNWIGTIDFTVTQGARPLGDFLTVTTLNGLNYPSPRVDKPYAAAYSYWRDFSAAESDLSGVTVGTAHIEVVRQVLSNITGDAWSSTAAQRYSLLGATVTYAGSTDGRTDVNLDYAFAVIVALDETNSVGLSGSLILHYNPPIVD